MSDALHATNSTMQKPDPKAVVTRRLYILPFFENAPRQVVIPDVFVPTLRVLGAKLVLRATPDILMASLAGPSWMPE
eukprot:8723413-Pyramimonas_sp.AAC.1